MENVNRHIHLAHHFRAKKLTKNVQIDCMKDFFFIFIMMKAYCTKSINLCKSKFKLIYIL